MKANVSYSSVVSIIFCRIVAVPEMIRVRFHGNVAIQANNNIRQTLKMIVSSHSDSIYNFHRNV